MVKIILLIFLLFILLLLTFYFLFENDQTLCLSDNYCKEGLKLNTEIGEIIISKETCIQTKGRWEEDRKWCNYN